MKYDRLRYVIPHLRNLYNFGVALFVAVGSLCYDYASSISAALIGYRSWIILVCLTVIYSLRVFFFLPETKGTALEDISVLFGDPVG